MRVDYTDGSVRYRYELPEGTVWATVSAAKEKTWHDSERGNVRAWYPTIRVHTTEEPNDAWADTPAPGFVKIRGREYRIDRFARWIPEGRRWEGWNGERVAWTLAPESDPYRGGFRTSDGGELSYKTKAYARLREMLSEVGDMLAAEDPGWRAESIRLALESERRNVESDIERARKAISEAEAKIAALEARIVAEATDTGADEVRAR